jgi:hypothetical protein
LAALIPYLQSLRGRLILNTSLSPTSANGAAAAATAASTTSTTSGSASSSLAGIPTSSGSGSNSSHRGAAVGSPGSDEDIRGSSSSTRPAAAGRSAPPGGAAVGSVGHSRRTGGAAGGGGLAAADDEGVPDFNEQFRSDGDAQLLELIDTVLLKSYLLTDTSLVLPFLQQKNFCHVEEAQVGISLSFFICPLSTDMTTLMMFPPCAPYPPSVP